MNRLANKVALITGAGRGIGAAIALAFAREGAAVVLAELDIETAQQTARDIEAACKAGGAGSANAASGSAAASGAKVLAVQTDVTQSVSVQQAVREAGQAFGPVDVLVNNAGINVFCDPLTMSDDDWRRCFAVDLDGVWNGCRAVLPGMVERGAGSIINIASTHAFKIIPGCFPYPVAKHGVIGLTRALGIEYAPRNVRVNAIAPGYVETQLTHDWWNGQPDPVAAQQATLDLQPMKRIGRPEEVAMTAVFLASDEAPFINAETIVIDGGRSVLYHD
jgi:NAD(P)-dependent dehydrogenase (short-subunit alcohol dehydrogenase family)